MSKLAIIRVRGKTKIKKGIKDTLTMLRLHNKNYCVVVSDIKSHLGMINKMKDYITWGEINEETFVLLLEKRGRLLGDKPLTDNYLKEKLKLTIKEFAKEFLESKNNLKDVPNLKLFFRLSPPRKGYARKGTKLPFSLGGALGNRKEKINELIKRMI